MITDKQKYEAMVNYFIGVREDKDDDFVACKTKEDFDNAVLSLIDEDHNTLVITYKNHNAITSDRKIKPLNIFYGSTTYYPEEQWLLKAFDVGKNSMRIFAMKNILKIG